MAVDASFNKAPATTKPLYRREGDRLTLRENFDAVMKGEQPDYVFDFPKCLVYLPDPDFVRSRIPMDGQEHKDSWGTVKVWVPGAPGAHPVSTPDKLVITDIEKWREQVVFPEIENLDWSKAKAAADAIDRKGYFVTLFMPAGLFERSHFLMGMEDAFCNYLEEPEEMTALLEAITEWKIRYIEIAAKECHPDAVFWHDDWGSKQNLFLPPDVWREIIKPLHTRIVKAAHDNGMLFFHHADCICEPIVEDMVEMGIDLWQGVIPQNNIEAIQKITEGKLAMNGGIDGPEIDAMTDEEEIRQAVRDCIDKFCPAGRFFPGIPSPSGLKEWNVGIVEDELDKYGRQWVKEHPAQ